MIRELLPYAIPFFGTLLIAQVLWIVTKNGIRG
jgi:hypothetical protein